jgi:hypothetical protein
MLASASAEQAPSRIVFNVMSSSQKKNEHSLCSWAITHLLRVQSQATFIAATPQGKLKSFKLREKKFEDVSASAAVAQFPHP